MRDEGRALVRAFRGPAEGLGHRLAEVFGSVGAFAPSGLSLATTLASATNTSALTVLPALLAGFFGVCSPRAARAAERQLTLLAQELASVRAHGNPDYFKREGALQLIRDFIPECARKETEEERARLRRVLVQGARLVAPLDRTRTLFGIAARLSAAEVHILCVLAAGQGEASAGAREEDADASARERTDSAGALEELEHELQHLDELTEAYPGARDVLIREGLVTPADDRKSRAEDALAMRVTELGRQFLAWTAEPNPPDESHLPAATARPLLGSTR